MVRQTEVIIQKATIANERKGQYLSKYNLCRRPWSWNGVLGVSSPVFGSARYLVDEGAVSGAQLAPCL